MRRTGDKFYVGNLVAEERINLVNSTRSFLKNPSHVDFSFLDEANSDLIKILTINFSGAAVNDLKTRIVQHIELTSARNKEIAARKSSSSSVPIIQITRDQLIELIHKVAVSFKVKFGGLTIAELIKSTTMASNNLGQMATTTNVWTKFDEHLKNSTGRILIDLNQGVLSMQFELNDGSLFELFLGKEIPGDIRFLSHLVPFILFMSIHLKIDYIKLIDTEFTTILQGAESDSSVLNLIFDCFVDFEHYNNGLLLFDADTVVGVQTSGTDDATIDENLSQSIKEMDVWQKCILHIFKSISKMSNGGNDGDEGESEMSIKQHPWCIFVTSSKFLVDQFKAALVFPLTDKERREKEENTDNKEKVRLCLNCDVYYKEVDNVNNFTGCTYHNGLLLNKMSKRDELVVGISKSELLELARENLGEAEKILKDYIWSCCMRGYTDSDGCKKNKHDDIVCQLKRSKAV